MLKALIVIAIGEVVGSFCMLISTINNFWVSRQQKKDYERYLKLQEELMKQQEDLAKKTKKCKCENEKHV